MISQELSVSRVVGCVRANINLHEKIDRAIAFVTEDNESFKLADISPSPVSQRSERSKLLNKVRKSLDVVKEKTDEEDKVSFYDTSRFVSHLTYTYL